MNKNLKRNILIVTIIVSLAIVFVPVYFFVLADDGDDNKLETFDAKIIEMVDGTANFDSDDDDSKGTDSSPSNNRVRTFDSIKYTVSYELRAKQDQTISGNLEGRNVLVEILLPSSYEAKLRYGESVTVNMDDRSEPITIGGNNYYYASFSVPIPNSALSSASTFDFVLENVNTTDYDNNRTIEPLVFVRESTDNNVTSVSTASTLPNHASCAREINVVDQTTGEVSTATSDNCSALITGKENYFVNLYLGNRKTDTREVPVGIVIGLKNVEGKGIKGQRVPKNINFTISNSDSSKLTFNENSFRPYRTYQSDSDYKINDLEALSQIENGEITATINDNTVSVSIANIKDYLITQNSDSYYYFATDYFVTTLAERTTYDYSDISVNLTANTTNSSNIATAVQIVDSYEFVVGNYLSNIDIYESSLISNDSVEALPYGKSNINYGSDFVIKTSFDYSSLANSTGSGLTSLTNYVKIDNDAFKLINDKNSNKGYNFIAGEVTSTPTIKLDTEEVGGNPHDKVLFGFGEWNSTYFALTNVEGCPSDISLLSKEQLMNLYGGPCLTTTANVKWAYSPVAENDINGNPLNFDKGPLIVESTYVTANAQRTPYVDPGSSGTLELYGSVIDDYTISETSHQIVTNATAYGKNSTDLKYFGYGSLTGENILKERNNFNKTNYDFAQRKVVSNNTNICANDRCPVSGATILISGLKVTKPVIKAYKATNLDTPENNFYYYPIALRINANASRGNDELRYNTIYVDVYLPDYMMVDDHYGASKNPYIESTTLSSVRNRLGLEAPVSDVNYNVYHYVLTTENSGLTEEEKTGIQQGRLSNFTIYSDIDLITTPNGIEPEIYAVVDFKATKYLETGNGLYNRDFASIVPESDRYDKIDIKLYNSAAVTTKATIAPNNIEKNGSYTFNMLAYNHSSSSVQGGYSYPTADLYYVLPYNGDLSGDSSSKIGSTKYTVSIDEESMNSLINAGDYKFYYTNNASPSEIIPKEVKSGDTSITWNLWEDPTVPTENVIAIKIVKQTPFEPDTYFGSSKGIKVNVDTVGSSDGNTFYNSFHILATKPDNYTCNDISNPDYCSESMRTKANYASSSVKTSVYERIISGFVFEDFDYNGIYTSDESRLKDIPVSLYKINEISENYDPVDPTTFVKENDTLVSATVTGENGNYYFGGLSSGNYYVSYTIDNAKYIVTDINKIDESIPDSSNNNSSASLLSNTNRAISNIISFPEGETSGKLIISNVNLGLAIKKEMAISLNKYITEVTVTRDGKTDTYDYSNQNATQVAINVLNPKNTKVQVKYSFVIENTKYFPGYVGMIVDSMPTDMTFNPNIKENQYWVSYDNLLYYNGLAGKLLLPNEKQYFSLVLDLDLKQGGIYRNVVSARDLTLMGDELPIYDFGGLNNTSANTNQGGE